MQKMFVAAMVMKILLTPGYFDTHLTVSSSKFKMASFSESHIQIKTLYD